MLSSFRSFGFSIERMSFVFYLTTLIFLLASLFISISSYVYELNQKANEAIAFAYAVEGFMLLLPAVLLFYLVGRIIDAKNRRYIFRNYKYGVYIGSSTIIWVLVYSFDAWIIGQIYFGEFILFTLLAIAIGISINEIMLWLKKRAIKRRNLANKTVINELGTLIGKVAKVDAKRGGITVETPFGNPITYSVDRIVEISDRIIIS